MPRRARTVLPGYFYHITQRGNYQQDVFRCDQDRAVYLQYLEENAKKYRLKIFAFCLMTNHVHFIVMPEEKDSLAKTFRVTHQRFSLYINKRDKLIGHLWQARYYSCLLLGSHFLRAMRYVERNPVRAGLVLNPDEYVWSSARANLGLKYNTITLSSFKEYFKISSWKEYILQPDHPNDLKEIRENTLQGKACGETDFIEILEEQFNCNLSFAPQGRPKEDKKVMNHQ